MLNMTYLTFPLFCHFALVGCVLQFLRGLWPLLLHWHKKKQKNKTEPVLSTTKQIQETHNFKINHTSEDTSDRVVMEDRSRLQIEAVYSSVYRAKVWQITKNTIFCFCSFSILEPCSLNSESPPLWQRRRVRWWMIEDPHLSTLNFHSSIWQQHYLLWQTLAVCGVSPHWCRNGMDAESALCERQTRQKIEQPNNQFV